MSVLASPDRLLETRGVSLALDAFVVRAVFNRVGTVCAFALGDGTVRLLARGATAATTAAVHDGSVLSLCPDPQGGFLSGGDDGQFCRISADGTVSVIETFGMKWVEHVAAVGEGKSAVLACSVGKHVHLYDGAGKKLKTLTHPSSVTGIVFDPKGKRVAASHYNGVSVWFVASKSDNPRVLEWKGSHTGLAMSPDGDSIVTSMQENALHGWRMSDSQHMRMTGYPAKTESLSFTKNGKWLASSGAESVVLWPFHGGGPMGKPPTELAGGDGVICTRTLCHPLQDAVAAGFNDGLVVMAEINSGRILPVMGTGRGAVSALAWSPDGVELAIGTESGYAAVVDFSKR